MKKMFLALLLTPLLAHADKLPCAAPEQPGDTREIECPITAIHEPQRFSFKALFAGGHDDTSAAMTLSLDGAPLACEPGSKVKLFAEDGDVFLQCRFTLAAKAGNAGNKHKLEVALVWSHAQYSDVELRSQP